MSTIFNKIKQAPPYFIFKETSLIPTGSGNALTVVLGSQTPPAESFVMPAAFFNTSTFELKFLQPDHTWA